jgi:hypothetical protein
MAQVHNGEMTPKEFLTEFQAHYAAEASETKLPVPPETSVDSPE